MAQKKFTLTPIVRQIKNNPRQYQVYMRVTFNRKSLYVRLPYLAAKSEVDTKKGLKLKPTSGTYDLAIAVIKNYKNVTDQIDVNAVENRPLRDIFNLIERLKNQQDKENNSFTLDFPDYMTEIASNRKFSTRKMYLAALTSLQDFFRRDHFDISEITSPILKKYESFLEERIGAYTSTIGLYIGAIHTVHKNARFEFNEQEKDYIPIKDPFEYFQLKARAHKKHAIPASRNFVQYLIDHRKELRPSSRRAADLFLLSFSLQGMNITDFYNAPAPQKNILVFNRTKTKDARDDNAETQVKIHNCILPLYKLYKDENNNDAFYFKNHYNKTSFDAQKAKWWNDLRIDLRETPLREESKKIVYYSARHTYSSISRELGIEKSLIRDGLSHRDPEAIITDIYVRKNWNLVWEANQKVLNEFDWTPLKGIK
ncbi:MAG: site-specific integrase [Bacteroidales bacterium]|nr:site-specific integrase [Bacteroidales bacterium]